MDAVLTPGTARQASLTALTHVMQVRPWKKLSKTRPHISDIVVLLSKESAWADEVDVADPLTRKRERDRQSQRRKREREREYRVQLEAKVLMLEQRLQGMQHLDASPSQIREHESQSRELHGHPHNAGSVIPNHKNSDHQELDEEDGQEDHDKDRAQDDGISNDAHGLNKPNRIRDTDAHSTACTINCTHMNNDEVLQSPEEQLLVVSAPVLARLLADPEWLRTPLNNISCQAAIQTSVGLHPGNNLARLLANLRAYPELEAACSPNPKPIDLLFGGSNNILANVVVSEQTGAHCLPPEQFATTWLIYLYCRWLVWPSKANYLCIPEYFRPSTLQLTRHHDLLYDLILWPQMRDNLIRYGPKHDHDAVFGLLSCTLRIRGSFRKEFIIRENDGDLQLDPSFYQKFMDISNWGILERFWLEYPDLVRGFDPSIMLREQHLL
ncbi:hypothetical protein COCC4DRAFT_129235 [Bipolaris maydis ATCC 48331]|uniref:BZIP domain-containing protein n=4 Tax=Cochliobolus heterostrophus TaxID=5016 RepID=M2T1F4_COCH5|nr:uncharacterized protein COCC4DRAFT_129235 [Bipolaris maydis ATCC 48331]EMD91415.1 hypothetical protein COCHEDRAFT_1224575 [Bipolaris maydis C5]ENI08828.1 hypothetical protein COCC4DRAFT_129235 [Bipolaris maydis ATCC 48331]KAJ6208811.1 hypothetical protein PSV09DRAFT_1224575 [Bipolaris maydis]